MRDVVKSSTQAQGKPGNPKEKPDTCSGIQRKVRVMCPICHVGGSSSLGIG